MGKIFYILGKSASGKDSIFHELKKDPSLGLKGITMYTTRPRRVDEIDGEDYHFITEKKLDEFKREGKVIELRTYQTIHGPWSYGTMDDGQIDPKEDYLMVGVLESYCSMRDYFGKDQVIPIYIQVEDGERLARALGRERQQTTPKYAELCRRFLSDSEDFSEEKLQAAGIRKRYENDEMERCIQEIREMIHSCR